MSIRVLLISDLRLYREGLAGALAGCGRITLVGTAANLAAAERQVARTRPQVVVLDMSMPDAPGVVHKLRGVRVIALGVPAARHAIGACLEAGVGYLTRDGSIDDLVRTIEAAAADEPGRRLPAPGVPPPGGIDALTPRESQILEMLARGLSNTQIAREATIEVATVKNHVHNLLEKLGARRRGEAAAMLQRWRASTAAWNEFAGWS